MCLYMYGGHALVQECHADGVLRVAVQIVGGAVQRIDDPFVFGGGRAGSAGFLGCDFVLRVGFVQDFCNDVFGGAVDIGDEVVERLCCLF